jgi:hypothetical protein
MRIRIRKTKKKQKHLTSTCILTSTFLRLFMASKFDRAQIYLKNQKNDSFQFLTFVPLNLDTFS